MTRLSRRDLAFIAICVALAAASAVIIARYYHDAFPEASIDFRFDRKSSRGIAEQLLRQQRVDVRGMKHAVRFDSDDSARIFLERSHVKPTDVRLWTWHHRWFRPLQEEELSVDVAPTGEIVAFSHTIPEERAIAGTLAAPPLEFLRGIGVRDVQLISTSERRLPKRIQRIYTFDSTRIRPAGAPYRHTVTVDGNVISGYSQRLKVPDAWLRSYRELRSKNAAAGAVDVIFFAGTMIAAVVVFIIRLRRGDLHLRFLLGVGIAAIVLTAGTALNSMPAQLAYYDTNSSYPAFLGNAAFGVLVQCFGTAMMLIVLCGAGEVLYRERLPGKLAIPHVFTRRALGSRRVFLSLILGYALVPLFIAYQIVFYLTAQKFGAWSPQELPYDDLLQSALPWFAVLFAGFYPALSEEFLSRAFSIPFFERLLRSRIVAIVLAAFIWGFGHSGYANQPFYIRGVEVGIVGVIAGLLMQRFGLLPLLIWHYTVDAVYTATLMFASGNAYYVATAAASSLIFAVPLIAMIVFYLRNRGFVPDDDLSNHTLPLAPLPEHPEPEAAAAQLPPPIRVTKSRVLLSVLAVVLAVLAVLFRPPSPEDAINYKITPARAKEIARAHVKNAEHVIAAPVEGFRSWEPNSSREDGGSPGEFDAVAADYLLRNGVSARELAEIFRTRIEAGTWTVRFFTPMQKEEIFVEVDPRTSRAIGYHKYLDEQAPGASLTQQQALAIAKNAFAPYSIDVNAFELKEALTFQQPKRRDWLFHFQERTPLAAQAFRRVTVRVAGAEVTQFNKNVKVPESVERDATTRTFLNVVLFALLIIGAITLLAIVVAGLVLASRTRGLPWRRALRWTLILAIIPIVSTLAHYELSLFSYTTTMAWDTFRVRLATQIILDIAKQVGILFLALAGLEAAIPYAWRLLSREGRARFGRSAAIAALTAISLAVLFGVAVQWLDVAWPSAASISFNASSTLATPLPGITEAGQALFAAIAVAGAVALYAQTLRKYVAPVTIAALFCVMVDPSVTTAQAPLMLVRALLLALLVWLLARYVLGANPLAWPLTIFAAGVLQSAGVLLQNQRTDLLANGIALIALAVLAMAWVAWPRSADA
ncbi:MAG TPA: CPBP family intramembrane glutamic endopeptidase [Thermoanaerobaculia bacterium]|nr:CPBP family intramembrane glutamic endopeptidase [Thermoanaerobaculia bacterium]